MNCIFTCTFADQNHGKETKSQSFVILLFANCRNDVPGAIQTKLQQPASTIHLPKHEIISFT